MGLGLGNKTSSRFTRAFAVAVITGSLGAGGAVALLDAAPAGAASPAVSLPPSVVAAGDTVLNPTLELFDNTTTCAVYLVADGALYSEFGLGPTPQTAGRPGCIAE
jgi:hypothetical protein